MKILSGISSSPVGKILSHLQLPDHSIKKHSFRERKIYLFSYFNLCYNVVKIIYIRWCLLLTTLIINGSPKKDGDTTALISELIKHLDGEYKILSCFNNISPCNDCRFCWGNDGCSINDEMQDVYEYLDKCDNVVIASPIWFSCLSGPILNISSRLQTLYCSRVFRKAVREPNKNGVIILVGGEGADSGTEIIPTKTALTIMRNMSVKRPCVATVCSLDTNNIPAKNDEIALKSVREAASLLNNLYANKQSK